MEEVFRYIKTFPVEYPWRKIILHHSATPDGKTNDWTSIKSWHLGKTGSDDPKSPNFNPYRAAPMVDIGYHFGLENIDGQMVYMRGRPLDMQGAHTIGQNKTSIGICCVGNYDVVPPTDVQLHLLSSLIRAIMERFPIVTVNDIYPHRDFAKKTCPGRRFNMDKLKEFVKNGACTG